MDKEIIKLRSQDGQIFEVEESVAFKSPVIKNIAEGFDEKEEILLPKIKATVVEKVIQYMRHYKDLDPPEIEKPLKTAFLEEILPAWDVDFINLELEMIYELVLAANFLAISSLLELSCAKIASMIKGKSVEELRTTFHIENDLTAEEEAQIREENRWAELE